MARDPKLLAAITPPGPADAAGKARAFVEGFGLRAFRRPLSEAERTRYLALFNKGPQLFGTPDAFADGAELVIATFLQSPHFLYRSEVSGTAVNGRIALDGYEVASRLSYGLVGTMPDDALMAAAGAKQLGTRDGVLEQARRLLDTPAARQMVADFHGQLRRVRDYEAIKKDEKLSPLFPQGVGEDLKQETLAFVHDVVFSQGRGLKELLTATYTFANSRVGRMYGLNTPAPAAGRPDPFVRVELDAAQRAGLLTQMGFLAANAEEQMPNIIIRGVHIAHDVLCVDLPPPPDAVPPLPAVVPNSTNRQRVEQLTHVAPCNSCHERNINPLGFAFENLDGLGRFRTQDNGQPINARASYTLDGQRGVLRRADRADQGDRRVQAGARLLHAPLGRVPVRPGARPGEPGRRRPGGPGGPALEGEHVGQGPHPQPRGHGRLPHPTALRSTTMMKRKLQSSAAAARDRRGGGGAARAGCVHPGGARGGAPRRARSTRRSSCSRTGRSRATAAIPTCSGRGRWGQSPPPP